MSQSKSSIQSRTPANAIGFNNDSLSSLSNASQSQVSRNPNESENNLKKKQPPTVESLIHNHLSHSNQFLDDTSQSNASKKGGGTSSFGKDTKQSSKQEELKQTSAADDFKNLRFKNPSSLEQQSDSNMSLRSSVFSNKNREDAVNQSSASRKDKKTISQSNSEAQNKPTRQITTKEIQSKILDISLDHHDNPIIFAFVSKFKAELAQASMKHTLDEIKSHVSHLKKAKDEMIDIKAEHMNQSHQEIEQDFVPDSDEMHLIHDTTAEIAIKQTFFQQQYAKDQSIQKNLMEDQDVDDPEAPQGTKVKKKVKQSNYQKELMMRILMKPMESLIKKRSRSARCFHEGSRFKSPPSAVIGQTSFKNIYRHSKRKEIALNQICFANRPKDKNEQHDSDIY